RPWLCEVQTYKNLDTGHAQSGARVIARRKRAVRARIRDVRSRTRPYARKKGVSWLLLCTSKEVTRGLQPRKLLLFIEAPKTSSATLTPTLSRQRERGQNMRLLQE